MSGETGATAGPEQSGDATDRSVLYRIAAFVVRRPRAVLAVWLVAIAVLAVVGIGLEDRLSTPAIYVDGTQSNTEHDLAVRAFGDTDPLVVMLRGPRAAVERQGRRLERALDALPRSRAIAPWDTDGAMPGLRPSPRTAVVIASLGRTPGQEYTDIVPPVQRTVERVVHAPVRADVSGLPVVALAMRNAAFDASAAGERIALPILMVVLLLVFRSVLAALIPGIIGGTTVLASRGVMALLIGHVQLDSLATGLAAMMGLGLGVDYSLLVVSRFREEMRRQDDVAEAVRTTVATTGRAVLLAGLALLLTMLVAAQLLPGAIIVSAAFAIISASALSVLAAIFVVPAMLTILGPHLERWSLPRRSADDEPLAARWSRRLTRAPALASALILLLLLGGTALAFTLDTGASSPGLLPEHDETRQQYETVERTLGPGWGGPLEVFVDGGRRPVTEYSRLQQMASFEHDAARDPGVATMAGVTAIARGVVPLHRLPRQLRGLSRQLEQGRDGLQQLADGVGRARDGARQLSGGFAAAADGAGQLDSATGRTKDGASQLQDGLAQSVDGSDRLLDGMDRALDGGRRLAQATGQASAGAQRLRDGLAQAGRAAGALPQSTLVLTDGMDEGTRQLGDVHTQVGTAETQLATAWAALKQMDAGAADPQYAAALRAVADATATVSGVDPSTGEAPASGIPGIDQQVQDAAGQFDVGRYLSGRMSRAGQEAQSGLDRLARGAESLDTGLVRIAAGARRITDALQQLRSGGDRLVPGLERLDDGAGALAEGLGALQAGTGRLAGGLRSGATSSGSLTNGLGVIQNAVGGQQQSLGEGAPDLRELQRRSPGMFRSGYFLLASIDGARPDVRSRAGLLVNVDRGGQAARMLVIPTTGPLDPATRATQHRLQKRADRLADASDTRVMVAGPAAALQDYNKAMRDRVPLVVVLLSLTTMLVLIPVIRSLVLPLVAALLNVLTVGATFGVLALLFDHSFLGGPGYIDTIGLGTTITVIFGLSIDYEVFVLARMREEYVRTGDTDRAVTDGLRHTARVVTGAATIMIAVFFAFAISPFISIRDFGVGLAVAVFIDAFFIRMVALPAIMRLIGDRCWWLPGWLDRLLPEPRPHS